MRKPVVDYRQFRLNKLNTPEFSHLKYLLGWVVYFALYFITENLFQMDKNNVTLIEWKAVDGIIPFCEYFVIPYVFWYVLIVITLLWFALYNTEGFKRFQTFIIVTQLVAMAVYIIFPNGQALRPEVLPNNNIFSQAVGFLYSFDTSTNVCPSLHVAYSIGIASAWLKEKEVNAWWKIFVVFCAVIISLSTMFIKQHSAWDAVAAIPLGVLAEAVAYGKYWKLKIKK